MISHITKVWILIIAFYISSCQSSKFSTIEFSDGTYKGEINKKGKKHGKGAYVWLDGSTYEGDFKNDLRHGNGKFKWSNGETYKGDYLEDERTGQGIYKWPDGSYYEGSFLMGKRHGNGKYCSIDGTIYEGNWFDDLQHGPGLLIQPNQVRMNSVWKNGEIIAQPALLPKSASKPVIQKVDYIQAEKNHFSTTKQSNDMNQDASVDAVSIPVKNSSSSPPPNSLNNNSYETFEDQDIKPVDSSLNQISSDQKKPDNSSATNIFETIETNDPKSYSKASNNQNSNIWTGTVSEAEEKFITELVNGIDTVRDAKSKTPFSGKMQILNSDGILIGEVNLLDGQLHGEEVFINEVGIITEKNIWEKGVRID